MTRDDLYVTGNSWTMNMTLFRDIYDRADANGVISQDVLSETAHRRWKISVETNPEFWYGPFTGWIIRNAPFFFLGRILAEHPSEHPLGIVTQDVFKSFFGVYDDGHGGLEYREGHERIPKNWRRNALGYGLITLSADIAALIAKYPEIGRYVTLPCATYQKAVILTCYSASAETPVPSTHLRASTSPTSRAA